MTRIESNENWTGARAVLHPEFLRKTKTPQNDSGTIIARHIVNLNPSRHVYRHFKTEIRRAKLIYTARTIVERGILPTVSKTHFTPLEKKTFPRKTAAWGESKSKWVGFLRWNRKQKNRVAGRARGSRKMANFYARKLSRGSFRYKKTAHSDETGENSTRPFTEALRYESLPVPASLRCLEWIAPCDSNFLPAQLQLTDSGRIGARSPSIPLETSSGGSPWPPPPSRCTDYSINYYGEGVISCKVDIAEP